MWGSQAWPGHDKGLSGQIESRAWGLRILGLSSWGAGGPCEHNPDVPPHTSWVGSQGQEQGLPLGQHEPAVNTAHMCQHPHLNPQPNQPSSVSAVGSDPQACRPCRSIPGDGHGGAEAAGQPRAPRYLGGTREVAMGGSRASCHLLHLGVPDGPCVSQRGTPQVGRHGHHTRL